MELPRGAARARPRAAVASRLHAGALRELGQRPERRLVRQPAAVLRRAVPGVVPGRGRRHVDYAQPIVPDEARLPIDPSTDVPDGYTAEQRDQPGGFAGDPDVMDTWATSSLTPQIAGGWLDDPRSVRARVPDGSAAAGARHHPHLAVLDGAALAPRARLAAVDARGDLRAGCSIPTARRCRSRRATSSRRWGCSRSTAPTACATGRRAAGRAPTRRSTRRR